jgi:hypothetical protein
VISCTPWPLHLWWKNFRTVLHTKTCTPQSRSVLVSLPGIKQQFPSRPGRRLVTTPIIHNTKAKSAKGCRPKRQTEFSHRILSYYESLSHTWTLFKLVKFCDTYIYLHSYSILQLDRAAYVNTNGRNAWHFLLHQHVQLRSFRAQQL